MRLFAINSTTNEAQGCSQRRGCCCQTRCKAQLQAGLGSTRLFDAQVCRAWQRAARQAAQHPTPPMNTATKGRRAALWLRLAGGSLPEPPLLLAAYLPPYRSRYGLKSLSHLVVDAGAKDGLGSLLGELGEGGQLLGLDEGLQRLTNVAVLCAEGRRARAGSGRRAAGGGQALLATGSA